MNHDTSRTRRSPARLLAVALAVGAAIEAGAQGTVSTDFTEVYGARDSQTLSSPPFQGYISYAQPAQRETMVMDPCDDGIMMLATWGSGVWRSDDGGVTWQPKSNGLLNLLVDVLRADPAHCGRYYAAQAPEGGLGVGYVYRSDDRGETWRKVALTSAPLPPRMYVVDISIGPGTIWLAVANSKNACGATLRSDDEGQTWCAYQTSCDLEIPGATTCPTGPDQFPVNDSAGVDAVDDQVTGAAEIYWNPSKIHWPLFGTHRSVADIASVDWEQRDTFADEECAIRDPATQCRPVATGPPAGCDRYQWWWDCNRLRGADDYRAGERLRAQDVVPDPLDPTHRFARHKMQSDPECHATPAVPCTSVDEATCNTGVFGVYCDWDAAAGQCIDHCNNVWREGFDCCSWTGTELEFGLVYSDGTRDVGSPIPARRDDLVWKEIMHVRDFVSASSAWDVETLAFSPPRPGAPNMLFANLGPFVLTCDATNGSAACFDRANWDCAWNLSADAGGAALGCPIGNDWAGSDLLSWKRMSVSPKLGPDAINDLYFYAARRHAQLNVLRVRHEGGAWTEERLVDPRTCSESGPTLLTPTQILETTGNPLGPTRLLATSPRDLLLSTDGGQTWAPTTPRWFNGGGLLAQSPVNPQVVYHSNLIGIQRSDDGGVTWHDIEGHFNAPGIPTTCFNNGAPGCPGGCPPTTPCNTSHSPAGRAQVMSDGLVALGVDRTNDMRLLAATERGIWKWEYPFGTFPYTCLKWEGAVCAGEAWTRVHPPPDANPPTPGGPYVRCIAQDPVFAQNWYAGVESGGLLVSTDGGNTWISRTAPFTANRIVIAGGATPNRFVVAADDGVWISADGVSWTRTLGEGGGRDLSMSNLLVNGQASIVAAVTNYRAGDVRDGLYLSTNSGATWSKLVSDDFNQNFVSVLWSSRGAIFAGKVGDGIFRKDPGPSLDCGRLLRADAAASAGADGFGWAMSGLLDAGSASGSGPDCRDDWAALEFVGGTQVRVRLLDGDGADLRSPLDPADPTTVRGGSLAGVGDVDSDGCLDVSVGLLHSNGSEDKIRILSTCTGSLVSELAPRLTGFGFSQRANGRWLAVGAPQSSRVHVYDLANLAAAPAVLATPGFAGDSFGWDVEFGNVDGAGDDELLVSAINDSSRTGAVHVYARVGSSWILRRSIRPALAPGSLFGWSISSGHDGLGASAPDGFDDIVVGAPGATGSSGQVLAYRHVGDVAPVVITGTGGERLGASVLVTGDVTGDSLPDYLFGAPSRAGVGGVSIYASSGSSLASWCTLAGSVAGGQLGASLARLGDADQDLTIDILVADPSAGTGQVRVERVEF